jgi:toxin ParE1/3/4
MNVLWSAASVRHLHQAVDYIQGENFGGATAVRQRILKAAERLGKMLFSERVGRIDGTREAVVPRTPFIVVYRVSEKTVDILGIWHAAREWPKSF